MADQRYEYYITGDNTQYACAYMKAMTFTPQVAHYIKKVVLKIRRQANPGTSTVSIYPTATVGDPEPVEPVLVSLQFDANLISTAFAWVDLVFPNAVRLEKDVRYAITLIGGDNTANLLWWRVDTSAPYGYPRGNMYAALDDTGPGGFPATGWQRFDYDMMFEEWGGVVAPTVTTDAATGIGKISATLNGTLDDYGGEACDCGFEYGETTDYGSTTSTESKTTGETFAQTITGLTPGVTYHFRAVATNSEGTSYGSDQTFTVPKVSTDSATTVGQTTATLNGTLDNSAGETCDVRFEYGETTDYGSTTDWQSGKTAGDTFSQEVRGLLPGRVYHFRAQARNSWGTINGDDQTLHTEALSAEAHQELGTGFPLSRAEL